jgi:hypothetical protein
VHILPDLGHLQVAKLTTRRVEDWHHDLAEKPALAGSAPGRKQNHRS